MGYWKRSGECNMCGECCIKGGSPYSKDMVGQPCPHLDVETKQCELHNSIDTYWSKGCNVWPQHPGQIRNYPSCSFSFTWVEDGTA